MEASSNKLIVTIVGKGKSGRVIKAAHHAGASGATVLNGHGAAVQLFLGISIDPEKDIVFTIIEEEKAQAVLNAISREMDLEQPHKGLAFMISLDQVIGIRKSEGGDEQY